jgi:isoamylase
MSRTIDSSPFKSNGKSYPIGSHTEKHGVNFCLFSKNCQSVDLLLFKSIEDIIPNRIINLDPHRNHTYHYWHIFVPGIERGQLYGYRINGPNEAHNGNRFDPGKVLLDPYANAVAVPAAYNRKKNSVAGAVDSPSMKSVVTDLSEYDWGEDRNPRRSFAQTVIYEMHVGGFTRNPNSGLSIQKRGTYSGLIEKIPYLTDLGITAVELLPVFQFDAQDSPEGLTNYWGYSPVSFFAPHQGYATNKEPMMVLNEFRDMVKALHNAGIEVILDVVFNHTAEGGMSGPSFCFKGIDNSIYYILENDKTVYSNFSGTGNTLNANQPVVRRMIVDSLRFWVNEMHVDGFRFDLASILSRNEKGIPIENAPVLWDIESDPVLAGTKLIAEAWDAAGLYQVGSFIGDSWREWNGKFRDDIRSFMKGDRGCISRFASRILGSPDVYGHENREAEQSINFITCHDGFTLNDLVSYNSKHNESNGEENHDGSNDNFSWNCGLEGPCDDPAVNSLRKRQIKNFMVLTLLSVGAPMVLMGDEVLRTQNGNNNGYCQDNEISWFDWHLVEKHADILRFLKHLINQRLGRDTTRAENAMSLMQLMERRLITWHGVKPFNPDWSDDSHSLAITVQSLSGRLTMYFMINAYTNSLEFEIPVYIGDRKCNWKKWIDTSGESPDDISELTSAKLVSNNLHKLNPYSLVVLIDLMEGF